MNRFKHILLCILLFVFYTSSAQQVVWEKSYGWEFRDNIRSIIHNNNNYYSSGLTSLGTDTVAPITIVKMNINGDTLFVKSDYSNQGWTQDVVIGSNRTLFLLSSKWNSTTFSYDKTLITKIDTSGNFLWSKEYNIGDYDEYRILSLADQGAIFIGRNGNIGLNCYATRIDSLGNEVWNTTFNKPGFQYVNTMIQLRDGSFLMSGYQILGTRRNIFYLQFGTDGNEIASDTIVSGVGDGNFISGTITQAMNGDYFVAAANFVNDSMYLIRMDSNFNYIWHFSKYEYGFFSPQEMLDGTIILGGTDDNDATLMKLDANGNLIKEVVSTNSNNTLFNDIAYDGKGGAVLAGKIDYFGTPARDDFYYVKFDNVGIPAPITLNCTPPTIHKVNTSLQSFTEVLLTDSSSEYLPHSTIKAKYWHFQDGTTAYGDSVYKDLPAACPTSFWAMLVVVDGIGCSDTLTIDVCTGQTISNPDWPIPNGIGKRVEKQEKLKVYPNPFKETFTIDFSSPSLNVAHNLRKAVHSSLITFTDLQGRQITNLEYRLKGNRLEVETSLLERGVYLISIEGVGRAKLVKE